MSDADLLAAMQPLEAALLHTDFRADPAALDALLAPDFLEVTPLGGLSTRAEVVQWLLQKDPAQRWQFSDWQAAALAPDLRLVRYHAVRSEPASASKGARHVSLWRRDAGSGHWRLYFHQSTKVV